MNFVFASRLAILIKNKIWHCEPPLKINKIHLGGNQKTTEKCTSFSTSLVLVKNCCIFLSVDSQKLVDGESEVEDVVGLEPTIQI